jgi:hypothetical protein
MHEAGVIFVAERSVSTRLTLKIANFLAGAKDAQRSLTDLNRKFVETAGFASGFRKKLDDAFKRLPKIEIDANSTPAEVKIAELRSRLEKLRDKKVGVDIDAGAALAEMNMIQRELAAIDDRDISFDVRAGVSAAMADLAAVNAEVNRLDGRDATVNVNADVSGAMRGIAMVGAAMAALAAAPAIVSIGAAGLALGGAFGAAGAGALGMAAVAVPAISRVNEALKQQQSAAGGAGGATKSLAQKQAEAASAALRMAQAQERVRKANEQVKDAARAVVDAHQDVKRAQDDVARAASDGAARVAAAVRRVSDAERQHSDAVRAARDAQQALNDARKQAVRDLEDLANRLTGTQLDLRTANLDLVDAKRRLDAVLANKSSSSADIERATIAYEQAQLRVKELTTSVQRLQTDKAEADSKGVEGSDLVKSAQDRLADANQRVVDSQQAIADAQADVARAQADAARSVADAQERVADAQEKLIDAQRRYSDAQRDAVLAEKALKVERLQQKAALTQVGGAAGGAASKMAELNAEERKLADRIKSFQDEYKRWQQSLEKDVFPAIIGGLDLIQSQLPRISPIVRAAGKGFVLFEKDARKALTDPFWDRFIGNLSQQIPTAIRGLGGSFINVTQGIAGMVDAWLPFTPMIVGGLERITAKFRDWGVGLGASSEFQRFIAWVGQNGPPAIEALGRIGEAVGKIIQAFAKVGAGVGQGLLMALDHIARLVNSMSPAQVEAIAQGVGAVFLAMRLGQGIKIAAIVGLAEVVSRMDPSHIQAIAIAIAGIYAGMKAGKAVSEGLDALSNLRSRLSEAGDASGGTKGKLGMLTSFLGGPWGVAIGAGITAVGLFAQAHADAEAKVKSLTDALKADQGAIGDNVISAVRDQLESGGILEAAQALKLNLDDVAKAAAGDADAFARFNQAMLKVDPGPLDSMHPKVKALADANHLLSGNALLVQQAVVKQRDALTESQASLGRTESVTGKTGDAITEMGDAAKMSADQIDKLRGRLDELAGKNASAIQSEIAYKEAIDKATQAAKENGATLNTNTAKGRDNKQTLVELAEKARTYAQSLRDQKRPMSEVNELISTQRDQFIQVAQKMGLSKKAASDLATQLGLIPGKVATQITTPGYTTSITAIDRTITQASKLDKIDPHVKVTANTKPALDTINQLIRTAEGRTIRIGVDVRSDKQEHGARAPRRERGGIDAYASGGIRANRARGPKMATRPTVLFGEGRDKEAFIPYDRAFRSRAEKLLSQVAADFGMQLLPADNVASAVQSASANLSTSLSDTASTLMSTLGGTGSLTSSVDELGRAADELSGTMLDAIRDLANQIRALDSGIDALSAAVSSAGSVASAAKASTSSSTSKQKIGTAVSTKVAASARKSTVARKTTKKAKVPVVGSGAGPAKPKKAGGVFIEPMAMGGMVRSPLILAGEAGKEMVIPLDPGKRMRGLDLLRQAAQMMGQDVTPRRAAVRSRPMQASPGIGSSVTPELVERIVVKAISARQPREGLKIENYYEAPGGSARQTAEELHLLDRRG